MSEQPDGGTWMKAMGFICHTCGQYHPELPMDFGVDEPYPYLMIPAEER